MANVSLNQGHQANLARTSFDLSQSHAFTASTGMILPVYSHLLNVGEKAYLNSSWIVRTNPLVTAAMADIHLDVDWFFVPMSMLFTLWPSMRYMTNDPISDNFVETLNGVPNIRTNGGYFPIYPIDQFLGYNNPESSVDYVMTNDGFGAPSNVGVPAMNRFRLADMLGFDPMPALYPAVSDSVPRSNPNVFPYKALAYQCIYQNFYRSDIWERKNVKSYNCDSAAHTTVTPSGQNNPFVLRFRQRRFDYFNNVTPTPVISGMNLIGGINTQSTNLTSVLENYVRFNQTLFDFNNALTTSGGDDANIMSGQLNPDVRGSAAEFNLDSESISINALRSAFALDKLSRIIGMSKKDYDSQILAHFGFKVPHDDKHDITHIFHQHSLLHIGEILSSADTYNASTNSGSSLGSVGGRGYGLVQKDKHYHKFTAPVDGVIMACVTAVPDFRYFGTFDKQNSLARNFDLYTPEIDKLGKQPLFGYEARARFDSLPNSVDTSVVAWQFRYAQWKQKYNRSSFAFAYGGRKSGVNVYSPWVLAETPYMTDWNEIGMSAVGLDTQICPPWALNGIMQVNYNMSFSDSFRASPWMIYQTDPFICDFTADVRVLSTMSPTGEPDLGQF